MHDFSSDFIHGTYLSSTSLFSCLLPCTDMQNGLSNKPHSAPRINKRLRRNNILQLVDVCTQTRLPHRIKSCYSWVQFIELVQWNRLLHVHRLLVEYSQWAWLNDCLMTMLPVCHPMLQNSWLFDLWVHEGCKTCIDFCVFSLTFHPSYLKFDPLHTYTR